MMVKYKIRDSKNLKFQALDYMSLLYDKLSGITHIIADPAPQIIEALGDVALSPQQIERLLKKQFDMQIGDDAENVDRHNDENSFENIIAARLEEFVDLGIVEREISK